VTWRKTTQAALATITAAEYRPAWTGITEPRCDDCSWAWHDGRMEIKYINPLCGQHRKFLGG
jgi:hypothetical protein